MGEVWGGAVGGGKYWLAAIVAISAGFVADQVGTAKTVVGLFILMATSFLLLAVVPGTRGLIHILLVNAALVATTVYASRGIYYALLEQGNVPLGLTGTAVGMVSVIGYTPDTLAPMISGLILDAWPGAQGFQVLYGLICFLCILGLSASVCIYSMVQGKHTPDEGIAVRVKRQQERSRTEGIRKPHVEAPPDAGPHSGPAAESRHVSISTANLRLGRFVDDVGSNDLGPKWVDFGYRPGTVTACELMGSIGQKSVVTRTIWCGHRPNRSMGSRAGRS